MKVVIKTEKPDLKMADILKVVAERWKNLTDDQRVIFQRKAQVEKELTKIKMNEHMNHPVEETHKSKKDVLPKKHVQSQKRVQKALLKESVKVESTTNDTKAEVSESTTSTIEEPPLKKQQVINICYNPMNSGVANTTIPHFTMNHHHMSMNSNYPYYNFNPNTAQIPMYTHNFPNPLYYSNYNTPVVANNTEMGYISMNNNNNMAKQVSVPESEFCLPELNLYNHASSFNKIPSADPLMNKYPSRDDREFNRDLNQNWNSWGEPQKQNSYEIDLMNFHSIGQEAKQDYVKWEEPSSDDDEYLPSTATNMSPVSNSPSNRQKMNDYLMSALETSDFNFDPLTLAENPDEFWKNRGSSMLGASH
jgi:hypothetical protein